jgi:hypothetical protein
MNARLALIVALVATLGLYGCGQPNSIRVSDALRASEVVASSWWDSGQLTVRLARGRGAAAAERVWCNILVPLGVDEDTATVYRWHLVEWYPRPDCQD